jgi:hypothetical protein
MSVSATGAEALFDLLLAACSDDDASATVLLDAEALPLEECIILTIPLEECNIFILLGSSLGSAETSREAARGGEASPLRIAIVFGLFSPSSDLLLPALAPSAASI